MLFQIETIFFKKSGTFSWFYDYTAMKYLSPNIAVHIGQLPHRRRGLKRQRRHSTEGRKEYHRQFLWSMCMIRKNRNKITLILKIRKEWDFWNIWGMNGGRFLRIPRYSEETRNRGIALNMFVKNGEQRLNCDEK